MATLEIELLHGHINHDPHFSKIRPIFSFTCRGKIQKVGAYTSADVKFVNLKFRITRFYLFTLKMTTSSKLKCSLLSRIVTSLSF